MALSGEEQIDICSLNSLSPGAEIPITLTRASGKQQTLVCRCRIDTGNELTYFRHGGILQYVIRKMLQ